VVLRLCSHSQAVGTKSTFVMLIMSEIDQDVARERGRSTSTTGYGSDGRKEEIPKLSTSYTLMEQSAAEVVAIHLPSLLMANPETGPERKHQYRSEGGSESSQSSESSNSIQW
jgi:hypothetical protein